MLALHDISTTLHAYWLSAAPAGVPTMLSGINAATAESADWFEYWIDLLEGAVRRDAGPDEQTLLVTVHCFSKQTRDTLRAQSLADDAVQILARRTLPIHPSGDPDTTTGYVRISEPSLQHLTRLHIVERQQPLQHVVVSFTARATAMPT